MKIIIELRKLQDCRTICSKKYAIQLFFEFTKVRDLIQVSKVHYTTTSSPAKPPTPLGKGLTGGCGWNMTHRDGEQQEQQCWQEEEEVLLIWPLTYAHTWWGGGQLSPHWWYRCSQHSARGSTHQHTTSLGDNQTWTEETWGRVHPEAPGGGIGTCSKRGREWGVGGWSGNGGGKGEVLGG